MKEKMETGIPASDKTIDELKAIGQHVGLRYEDYFN